MPDGSAPVLRFVVPEGLGYASGGTMYNSHVAEALRSLGVTVNVVGVPGAWPVGSAADRRRLAAALDPAHDAILVDGLLALGAPGEIRAAARRSLPMTARGSSQDAAPSTGSRVGPAVGILVHMSLADAPGLTAPEAARFAALDRESLAVADTVLVPSDFSARRLAERYGTSARVARPGVVRVPVASGSISQGGAPHLLCLAALLPGKGQRRLVRALGALRGVPWTLTLAGHDAADSAYARILADEAARLGIGDRVLMPGELRGARLEEEWGRADLTVLASESETFGLVVTESIARGVPALVAAGTGATEALGLSLAGGLGPAGTVAGAPGRGTDPLTVELGRWLADPALRARWRAAALGARPLLPGWEATARAVAHAMGLRVPRP